MFSNTEKMRKGARKGKPEERSKANTRQSKHVKGDKRERWS